MKPGLRRLRDASLPVYYRLQRRISPDTRFSQTRYESILDREIRPGVAWLDVGCGRQLLPEWRTQQEGDLTRRAGTLVGLDPDLASLASHGTLRHRICGDLSDLPFPDGAFDLVTANMVVEHLQDPVRAFVEIARVLKPGGVFLFHTPNARSYATRLARLLPDSAKKPLIRMLEGRRAEDVFPAAYHANTTEQLQRLAARAGLASESVEHVTTSAVFAVVPPLAILELFWIRMLERPAFARWRQTLIGKFRRPGSGTLPNRTRTPPGKDGEFTP